MTISSTALLSSKEDHTPAQQSTAISVADLEFRSQQVQGLTGL